MTDPTADADLDLDPDPDSRPGPGLVLRGRRESAAQGRRAEA